MTNAGLDKLYESLISPLHLTIKLEDAINRIAKEIKKATKHQQVIFHHRYNSTCTLRSNLVII